MHKLESLLASVGDMALKRRARWIITQLQTKPGDKIVDLGCGNGYYLYLLDNLPVRKLSVVGIDSDANALQAVNEYVRNRNISFKKANLEQIPFRDESFDRAIISEVIEHVENPSKVLAEIHRVLKPGGILLLTTPNKNFPFFWDPVNWFLQRVFYTHIKSGFWAGIWNQHPQLFFSHEIKSLLEKGGFVIEEMKTLTFWCLPFNHYFVNFWARLLYSRQLPLEIAQSVDKFKTSPKPLWLKVVFEFVNTLDHLNDIFPVGDGVSIFIRARKK